MRRSSTKRPTKARANVLYGHKSQAHACSLKPSIIYTALMTLGLSTQAAQASVIFDGSIQNLSIQMQELGQALETPPAIPTENPRPFEVTLEKVIPIQLAATSSIRAIKQDLSALEGKEIYGPFELNITEATLAGEIGAGEAAAVGETETFEEKITVQSAGVKNVTIKAARTKPADATCKPDTIPFGSDPFDSNITMGVQVREVTKEEKNRWVRASSPGYWPTLEYRAQTNCTSDPSAKLVSQAGVHLLARVAGMRAQTSMGLVIAKVAQGWHAQLSGRAEPPIVFALKPTGRVSLKPEELQTNDGFSRVYVFLNVAPGAHLLHFQQLTRVGAGTTGAIGAPVVEGHMTYIDASQAQVLPLSGKVLHGEYRTIDPVEQATLRPWGASENATTQRDGAFKFAGIATFGNFPTQIDVDFKDGYTHRFQVQVQQASASKDPTYLFVFGKNKVRAWVEQLSGGVSPLTGIVIGAAPKLVAQLSQAKADPIYPSVSTLEGDAGIKPEMYTLGLKDHLQVQTALTPLSPRFAGFSLPEGIHLIELQTGGRSVVSSQMVFSSPGVIEVLAPH